MIGALFFASIILVTIKHKKLHSACHFLIALFSLACFFNKTIFLAPFTMRIIVGGTLPLFICAFIQIIPLTFTFNIYPVLMAISIDRVFSIFFPIWYSHRNEFQFLVIFYSFTWIFPFYCIFATLSIVLSDPNSESQCSYLDLIGENAILKFHHAFFFNLFIFCCYFLMSIKLYFKNQVSASTRQPLFKSLFLVMFLQLFGWTSSICAYAFILPEFSDEQRSYFVYLINYYASLTTTGEVVAIYLTSSVHRKALKKEIGKLFGIFKENSNQQQNTIHIIRGSAQNWGNSTIQQIPKSN